MLNINAKVTLFGPEHNGLAGPVRNGLRPSFSYKGERVACEIWAEHSEKLVPRVRPQDRTKPRYFFREHDRKRIESLFRRV